MSSAKIVVDDVVQRLLRGWAARPGAPETDDDQVSLAIEIGSERIGAVSRAIERPLVDDYVGYGAVSKGFEAPLLPTLAFAAAAGLPSQDWPALVASGPEMVRAPIPASFQPDWREIALWGPDAPTLVDAWHAGASEFRVRLDGGSLDGTLTLAAFQALDGGEGRLRVTRVGSADLAGRGPSLASIKLLDALAATLLVLLDDREIIRATGVIPFPSLCRGGAHHPELRSEGGLGDDVADLERLSSRFLADLVALRGGEPRLFDEIVVDARGATGNEPIFSASLLFWVRDRMGVPVRLRRSTADEGDPALEQYLSRLIGGPDKAETSTGQEPSPPAKRRLLGFRSSAPPAPEPGPAAGGAVLSLPADAMPTISALTARRSPADDRSQATACPYLVLPNGRGGVAWSVGLPAVRSIGALRPYLAPYPIWSPDGSRAPHEDGLLSSPPMAIRTGEPASETVSSVLFPVAAEAAALAGHEPAGSVTACLAAGGDERQTAVLIETLATQDRPPAEVIVAEGLAYPGGPLRAALQAFFPDAHQVLKVEGGTSALLTAAAARASGDVLVFARGTTILHDRRTIASLATLARLDGVGSAGCMLLRPGERGFAFAGAGYFLAGLSMMTPPAVVYDAPDIRSVLPLAIYPVVANSGELVAVRAATFSKLAGFDPAMRSGSGWDVAFGLRVLAEGLVNLCTTALTAVTDEPASTGTLDMDVLRRLPGLDLARLAGATTSLRQLP